MKNPRILVVDDKLLQHFSINQTLGHLFDTPRVYSAFSASQAIKLTRVRQEELRSEASAAREKAKNAKGAQKQRLLTLVKKRIARVNMPFDVIISDLNMETRKAGIHLARELRKSGVQSPFALVSAAHELKSFEEEARQAGANAVHFKHEIIHPETARPILARLLKKR